MPKKLLFLLFLVYVSYPVHAQKNRYAAFFREIDVPGDAAADFKKLRGLKQEKQLNTIEKTAFYERVIPLTFELAEYDLALSYSFEAVKFARQTGNDSLLAGYLKFTGSAYYVIKDREKALAYYKKALSVADRGKAWFVKAMVLNNMGAIYIEQRKYGLAEKALKESIALCKNYFADRSKVLLPMRLLATLYNETGRNGLAKPLYEEVIAVSDEIGDTTMSCFSRIYYTRLLVQNKLYRQAVDYSGEAVRLAMQQGNKNTMENCFISYSNNLEYIGRFEESMKYMKKAMALRKEMFKEDLEAGIAETEVRYKTGEIKRQKELAESKAIAEKRKNSLYIVVFIGLVLALVVVFLAVYFRSQARRKKVEMALQQQYFQAVLLAQEKEKERIARDLHDGICQKFVAARMKFSFVSESLKHVPQVSEDYAACIALLDEATKELRNISHEIMPPDLSELGFPQALKQLAHSMFNHTMDYSFEVFGKEKTLDREEEIHLYRITQELFSNVVRHSGAGQVSAQLVFSDKQLMLMVEDDGVGVNQSSKKGMGLENINLRAEIIKARFYMEQAEGKGTLATLKLPF